MTKLVSLACAWLPVPIVQVGKRKCTPCARVRAKYYLPVNLETSAAAKGSVTELLEIGISPGAAHIRDGAAVVRFLSWFDSHAADGTVTEIAAVAALEPLYIRPPDAATRPIALTLGEQIHGTPRGRTHPATPHS